MRPAADGSERAEPEVPAEFTQGKRWAGEDLETLARVIDAAFDYRGDVTVHLRSGEELTGYLSNRDRDSLVVTLLPANGGEGREVSYRDIRGLTFSGRDTAAGVSWESWVKRYRAKKEAEARGEKTEEIGLFPEPLD